MLELSGKQLFKLLCKVFAKFKIQSIQSLRLVTLMNGHRANS